MKCPNCGSENSDAALFCEDCGHSLNQRVEETHLGNKNIELNDVANASSRPNSMSMGDKNVIAGDVDNSVETNYQVEGNASFVTNNIINDETKKIVACRICGKNTAQGDGYTCPKCGRFVCTSHYDYDNKCCSLCSTQIVQEKEIEKAAIIRESNKLKVEGFSTYRTAFKKKIDAGILTASDMSDLATTRIHANLSDSEARQIEDEVLSMNHVVLQKNGQLFEARGEKSNIKATNVNFQFNKTAFLINAETVENISNWKTGNLALSIWFSPKGPFNGNLDGCINMAAIDLVSLDSLQSINHVSRQSQIIANPPSGTYTPFFAVGEKFDSGFKIVTWGNFSLLNWNQR